MQIPVNHHYKNNNNMTQYKTVKMFMESAGEEQATKMLF